MNDICYSIQIKTRLKILFSFQAAQKLQDYWCRFCNFSKSLGCKPKSFWILARHGSRNPGDDDISQMEIRGPAIQAAIIDNHQNGKGELIQFERFTKRERFEYLHILPKIFQATLDYSNRW